MTRIFRCTCGKKNQGKLCIYRNILLTEYSSIRLLKRISHERNKKYIHIPKEKRTKLDPSGRKGIFIGYNDTAKAY